MDEEQEQEWLAQIAGGADPLTGLAAVPDDKPPRKGTGCLIIIVVAGVLWLLLRWL